MFNDKFWKDYVKGYEPLDKKITVDSLLEFGNFIYLYRLEDNKDFLIKNGIWNGKYYNNNIVYLNGRKITVYV